MRTEGTNDISWITAEHPGYQGKRKDEDIVRWNRDYGSKNWRIAWELADGEVLSYEDIFYKIYVAGYVDYFLKHKDETRHLTQNYSYAYDKDLVNRQQAFDPHHLYDKPGRPNQFHNVSLNIALEYFLAMPFRGTLPIQVREGKPNTPEHTWPEGYLWSPGRIPSTRRDLIPKNRVDGWWAKGSVEDVYQCAKILQVRS